MLSKKQEAGGVPVLLWGEPTGRTLIAVHGSRSSKTDACIRILAEEASVRGWQTLSFDLPGHGERAREAAPCPLSNCVRELEAVYRFAEDGAREIAVFGCSLGAYLCLLAYGGKAVDRALFLSPVTDMERLIRGMLEANGLTEEEFQARRVVEDPNETLYWEDFVYVKEHPITRWPHPTHILRGEGDVLCGRAAMEAFAARFGCGLTEQPGGEHWFHTEEELAFFRRWLEDKL